MTGKDLRSNYDQYVEDVLFPLMREGDYEGLFAKIEGRLEQETDPENRQALISMLSTALQTVGREKEGLAWCERAVKEAPEDPLAQNGLAGWYFYNPLRKPTADDLSKALAHNAVAVEKARASNTWRRNVLHDRCRMATAAKRFDIVEEAMREILDLWKDGTCIPDVPMFEWDWLDQVPDGSIDAEFRERYEAMVAAILEERKQEHEKEKAAGYADFMKHAVFTFDGRVRLEEGAEKPFSLTVYEPSYEEPYGWFAMLDCLFLRIKPFKIYGADKVQAVHLAVEFVRQTLQHDHVELVNERGDPVELPELPGHMKAPGT